MGRHEPAAHDGARARRDGRGGRLRARNLRTLALLAGLFLVPLLLAFFTYYGSSWRPAGTVNHGTLIAPARPLPQVPLPQLSPASEAPATAAPLLRGHWSLVYLGDGECTAQCRQALAVMRSARLALNNDMTRVAQRVPRDPGLLRRRGLRGGARGPARAWMPRAPPPWCSSVQFPDAGRDHTLFVVDPRGNLMMRYDARRNSRGLLEDLQKLLRLSHIG